jgi:hypothetical protein
MGPQIGKKHIWSRNWSVHGRLALTVNYRPLLDSFSGKHTTHLRFCSLALILVMLLDSHLSKLAQVSLIDAKAILPFVCASIASSDFFLLEANLLFHTPARSALACMFFSLLVARYAHRFSMFVVVHK